MLKKALFLLGVCTHMHGFLGNKIPENIKVDVSNIKFSLPTREESTDFFKGLGKGLPEINAGIGSVGQAMADAGKPMIYNALGAAATLGTMAVMHDTMQALIRKYITRYLFEPALIEKRSSRYPLFSNKKSGSITEHMVMDDRLKKDLNYLIKLTKNIKKNGGSFENVLLYGAPGTGKTLFAQLLAEHCGMDYAIIPAANVSQFLHKGTVVEELNNLFEWASGSKKGTILFFDEAETFLANRSTLDQAAQNALSLFLAKTGTPSDKFMIICTTNRPEILDAAVLSRLGIQIYFPLPEEKARKEQLAMHIKKVFGDQKGTVIQHDYLQDPTVIKYLSDQLEGYSGRSIQKVVNHLRQTALAEDQLAVDAAIIEQALKLLKKDKINQEMTRSVQ